MVRKDLQFMEMCVQGAKIFSTCGKRQYMALIVDSKNHIVGLGYNGGPSGFKHCKEGGCPRLLENSPSGSNYDNCIAVHAEQNAFLNMTSYEGDLRLYVNGPPCFTCAKMIVNSDIWKVFYAPDPSYANWDEVRQFLMKGRVLTERVGINASAEAQLHRGIQERLPGVWDGKPGYSPVQSAAGRLNTSGQENPFRGQ